MSQLRLGSLKLVFIILILTIASSAFSAINDHPAFKFKPNKELETLKPTSTSQTQLSRPNKKPSFDELHYEEKNPNDDATLVDTASIDPTKLLPSRIISIDPNQPELHLPDPQITIAGQNYILSIVETVPDIKQMVRYVTAKIVGHSGQARFIIDDATGEVVGNLLIDGETYRVLPRDINKDQQLIYQLKKIKLKDNQRATIEVISKGTSPSANRLERELLKAELLLDIKPKVFEQPSRKTGGTTSLMRGDIGYVDVDEIIDNRNVASIEKLLADLGVIFNSDSSYQHTITKVRGSKRWGYSVNYRQVINGIPLRSGSKIKFTSDGKVTELSDMMIRPDLVNIQPSSYSEAQVLEIAKAAAQTFANKPNLTFTTLETNPSNLSYKVKGKHPDLIPYWEIVLFETQSTGKSYVVFVEGHSGKATVRDPVIHVTTQIQTDVCEHEAGISLSLCQDVELGYPFYIYSYVRDIIEESATGQFICKYAPLCQDPQAKHPYDVIQNMEDWLSENTDGICCSTVGGTLDSLDVKINTPESDGPSYNSATHTATFPHPASLEPTVFNPVQAQKIDDAVVHEVTHGVIDGVNDKLSDAITDGDPWARALSEGFSDAMAVLYSQKFNPPGDTKIAEELFKDSTYVRDIAESKSFEDFVDGPGLEHENGKIFGNFIYRARQQGLSINQAAKVIVWIAEQINPDTGLVQDKTDEKDIKDAIDRITQLDQIIGAILQAVWGDMNGYDDPPVGGGGGGSTPPYAPSYVTGFFTGCSGAYSIYLDSWQSPPGALYYNLYYSTTGGSYTYFGYSFSSSSYVSNSVNGYIKVSACNSYGCSSLSSSTFYQPHLCGG